MSMTLGDYPSTLLYGLSDFWVRFFRDVPDLEAYYQASEMALGEAYLDLLTTVLNVSVLDAPVFDKEDWRIFFIRETDLQFLAGVSPLDDRFLYDMPSSAVEVSFLQNTIFEPTVAYEKDVDFEVENTDGYIRFKEDPFRQIQDVTTGDWIPDKGVAWRYLNVQTGNKFLDRRRDVNWLDDSDVKRGDTLRILAYAGVQKYDSAGGLNGQLQYLVPDVVFAIIGPCTYSFAESNIGDIIRVVNAVGFEGYYAIKEYLTPLTVRLEAMFYGVTASSGAVDWQLYKGAYFGEFQDYEIDYIDRQALVGPSTKPYPITYNPPLLYSVVRTKAEPSTVGFPLNGPIPGPTVMGGDPGDFVENDLATGELYIQMGVATPFLVAMETAKPTYSVTLGAPYNKSYMIVGVTGPDPSNRARLAENPVTSFGLSLGETKLLNCSWAVTQSPPVTSVGVRHLIPGTVMVMASKPFGGMVVENQDYRVDYYHGKIIPLHPWSVASSNHCSFDSMEEVLFSTSGEAFPQETGKIKELALWAPQVKVDNFSLYYNFGAMLNRFQASSDQYRAFLQGIMHFYVHGPVFNRFESALNAIAGLPLVRQDGEILQSYSDGIDGTGTDGELTAATKEFYTPTYTFTELDVGGMVVITHATNDQNKGAFRVVELIDANTVELESVYGFVDEVNLTWQVSTEYIQKVVTDKRTYKIPFGIPLKQVVLDDDGHVFSAFDALTTAFMVVDYLEDSRWWHNQYIPSILWEGQPAIRRLASTTLVKNVIAPGDMAEIGDPGLYIGADDEGNVTLADSDYRHTIGFILFDRYLKMHMFNVEIDPSLNMTAEFRQDLEEIILVAKPSYTYPYVKPGRSFEDTAELWEFMSWYMAHHHSDAVEISDTTLKIGSYLSIGDYYRYVSYTSAASGIPSPPAPGPNGPLPIGMDELIVRVELLATVDGGTPVREGTHYTFNYDPTSVDAWTFTPLGAYVWDVLADIPFSARVVAIDVVGTPPDTRIGFTPLFVGGCEPVYVRKDPLLPPAINELIDRAIEVTIDDGGASYTYP
jgi:hypothetical protein